MRPFVPIVVLLLGVLHGVGAAQDVDLNLVVTDESVTAGPSTTLIFGLDPAATDGFDGAPLDVEAPPPPPTGGSFDARITNTNNLTNDAGLLIQGFLEERRASDVSEEQVVVSCTPSAFEDGAACSVSWNPTALAGLGTITIQGSPGFASIDMTTTSSITIEQFMAGVPIPQLQPASAIITMTNVIPVELTSFDALVDGRAVRLVWQTASETNNAGFEVQHAPGASPFRPVAFVDGHGTTTVPRAYAFRVDGLEPGRHHFRLKQIDFDGAFEYSPTVEVVVGLPERFVLEAAYPNPFHRTATIRFALREAMPVRMVLFDALGREVRLLYDGRPKAGEMQVVRLDGNGLADGTYLIRLVGEDVLATQPVTLRE